MKTGTTKKKSVPDNAEKNAGSGAFNQGSKQNNGAKKIITISDHEKLTGHRPLTSAKKKR